MENKYFYCYSVKMKDFLKSQGFNYITKALNPRSQKPYFMFDPVQRGEVALVFPGKAEPPAMLRPGFD